MEPIYLFHLQNQQYLFWKDTKECRALKQKLYIAIINNKVLNSDYAKCIEKLNFK